MCVCVCVCVCIRCVTITFQPKYDMLPALDTLKEYIGMIQVYPDLLTVHRGAMGKVKESDKMKEEGRIDVSGWDKINLLCYTGRGKRL